MRGAWPLSVFAMGLSATLAVCWAQHRSFARVEKWGNLPHWWIGGVALSCVAAFCVWLARRETLLRTAQKLDSKFDAKNRLETAALLRDETSAIARLQREETAHFLQQTASQPRAKTAPLLALSALAIFLALSHFITLLSWTRPWLREEKKVAAQSAPPRANEPQASIKWKSPESETKAAPIEEVALEAVANSTSGLRDLVLEMSVNGEPRASVPISLDEVKKAGAHAIQTSLYLDQLEVQPYDIISYNLRAQRIEAIASSISQNSSISQKLPPTVSPVQFVQVKPFRDDVREMPGGGTGNPGFDLIKALKAAQLRLIKENFILAHAEIARDDADWKKENERVGHEQNVLKEKTGEVVEQLIQQGTPAEIVDLITQAKPLMDDAAQKIIATQNQPALSPQGKSLGLITAVEKYFIKALARGGSAPPPQQNVEDPFRTKKELEMKQRFQTKAGEMELLAAEQARLAEDLAKSDAAANPSSPANSAPSPNASKPDPNRIEGTPAERQTQISQRVGALLNGKIFAQEITQHLENGREQARDALHQLDENNIEAAREPAAAAARELRLAAEAMNRAGEQQAKEQLGDALRILSRAADQARTAPQQSSQQAARAQADEAAKQAQQSAADLAKAARDQQETGSAQAAARLAELANELHEQDLQKTLQRLREQPRDNARAQTAAEKLQQLADRAAQQRSSGAPFSQDEIARLADQLERARANLQRLANGDNANTTGNREQSSQQNQTSQQNLQSQQNGQNSQTQQSQNANSQAAQTQTSQLAQSAGHSKQAQPGQGKGDSRTGSTGQNGIGGAEKSDGSQQTAAWTFGQVPGAKGAQQTSSSDVRDDNSTPHAAEMREQFARELIDDLRDSALDAMTVLPQSSEASALRDRLREALPQPRAQSRELAAFISKIDPPLEGLIKALRAETRHTQRQHQLTEQNIDLAPPAYRPAVADYFENLSRDYAAAPSKKSAPADTSVSPKESEKK